MNLVERIERLEMLIGIGADTQGIEQLMESAKKDTELLQSLLHEAGCEMRLAGLDEYDFRVLWQNALPAILRQAKSRGYLEMEDQDIVYWSIYDSSRFKVSLSIQGERRA